VTTLSALVGVTVFATAARLMARAPMWQFSLLHDALAHRLQPWIMGAVAMAATFIAWGGIDPVAVYHDEAAYLLQAGIFATGRWIGSPPPVPAFFEQFHVLLAPGVAPKYPPGFAFTLVPGTWLHLPALMPLLLTGLTGGLMFALARRVAGGAVALLATALWVAAPGNLRFRAGFFSEILTSLLWLAGWWALLEWRATARGAWLLVLAACVGLGAITRPLTMLVFAIPVGVVVLRDVSRRRAWGPLAGAMLLGTAIVSLMPLHNSRITGHWRTSPYVRYTTLYLPFDRMGFGLDSTPAAVTLPADMQDLSTYFGNAHAKHTARRLPAIALQRVRAVLNDMGGPPALGAAALLVVGLAVAPGAVQFAAGTALLLLLAHLPYAHFNNWTLYYLEAFPVVALLMASGVARAGRMLLGPGLGAADTSSRLDLLLGASAMFLLIALPWRVMSARSEHRSNAAAQLYFQQLVREVPAPAVVFVRYGPRHVSHYSLIQNPPDYDTAPYWIVYDRGAENAELLSKAGERRAFLYDEARGFITPLAR
jgi:hypothetical protein